jgi:predicted site-specific integrase-resolvase
VGDRRIKRVDVGSVANACDVDRSTVLRWCKSEEIDARQLPGGRWRIAVDAEGYPLPAEE